MILPRINEEIMIVNTSLDHILSRATGYYDGIFHRRTGDTCSKYEMFHEHEITKWYYTSSDYKELDLYGPWGNRSYHAKYLRELETKNWHYYELNNGKVLHLSKTCNMFLISGTIEDILKNRQSKEFNIEK